MAEILVHEILWKQNSPYGTYVANDIVRVYWDDNTEELVVRVNNSLETSGDDIPHYFTYAGQTETYYKTEQHYFTLICSTARDKIDTYRFISAFPYLTAIPYPDHPSCAVAPAVCDLVFDSLPVVVNSTDAETADGELTVSASSSNGSIEYNLGGDFVYGEGQASGLFEDLLPGNYTVYARDEINCFAEISVTVGINYSYGVLLRLEYTDYVGGTTRVEILEKSYSGSVTEVCGFGDSPFFYRLRGEGEQDKFKNILTTETQVNLVSITDFQFLSLFTGDPDKYRIKFSKDVGSGYETKLLHKFLPNQYFETYKFPPYEAAFIGTDGTASLKDLTFTDANGKRLFGSFKQIAILAFCLKKLGLGLGFRCSINLYADTMDVTDADDPLDQAFVNTDRYYLSGDFPSCEFVVKAILAPYGAQIIQWGGYWNILRIEERIGSFDYRQFDEDGAYVSESAYNPVENVSNVDNNEFTWLTEPTMQMMPGYGKVLIDYDLGLQPNVLKNGDFRLTPVYSTLIQRNILQINFDGFQIVNNDGEITTTGYEVIDENNVALQLNSNGNTYILSKAVQMKMTISDKIKFLVRFKLPAHIRDYPYQKIKSRVTYGTYYLTSDGTWSSTENDIVFYAKEYGKYIEFQIVAGQPDALALDGFNISTRLYGSYVLESEFTTLAGLQAKGTTTLPLATRTELLPSSDGSGVFTAYIYYYELENNTSAESVPDIVRPTDYNAGTNPVQWILKKQLTSSTSFVDTSYFIDKIVIQYLPQGDESPSILNAEISAETNNPEVFESELFHGSLTSDIQTNLLFGVPAFLTPAFVWVTIGNQNAEETYSAYLRDSTGEGFVLWSRENVSESRLLHDIYLRTVSAQYSRPWRKLFGGIVSKYLYFSPIDSIKETLDSDRFYFPISLEVNDKQNQYNGEWVELIDVTDTSGESGGGGEPGSGAGFTTGFSIGFDS